MPIRCIDDAPEAFPVQFADYVELESLLDASPRQEELLRLKELRDKGLAHSEHVQRVDGPTWAAIADFVEIAKHVVGVLGWAYFQIAYATNGDYVSSDDARAPSIGISRLLNQHYGSSS